MNNAKSVSEVWLKASILGSTWAASEIILGSFLHNLRIPFNGNILTMIGFILLISASYKWKDRGLFWHSGLICALMKTISPSAVIFGPMIAIFIESMLLEISVRVFGRNAIGFFIGSALAMSWILVQKILNMILFYGMNIVEIYKSIIGYAEKQLHTNSDLVWLPIFLLLGIYILFGIADVIIGMRIGKSVLKGETNNSYIETGNKFNIFPKKSNNFEYSVFWLFLDFVILISMLIVINWTPVYVWVILTFIVIFIWISRYKRAMRQMMKPSFWIFFVIITMISAISITAIQGNDDRWTNGFIIGLQMNFRAAIVILGFTVLGTELYNPMIRNYFARTSFRQLPVALELAFESLPKVISSLPEMKYFIKNPATVIRHLIYIADKRFNSILQDKMSEILIITGNRAEGKTSNLIEIIDIFKEKNIKIGGFYSPRILLGDKTIGYDIVQINGGHKISFLRENAENDIGKFKVNPSAFKIVSKWLKNDIKNNVDIIIIDEIGKWELLDHGWANELNNLNSIAFPYQIWTVRKIFLEEVISKWNLRDPYIFDISEKSPVEIYEKIYFLLRHNNNFTIFE